MWIERILLWLGYEVREKRYSEDVYKNTDSL